MNKDEIKKKIEKNRDLIDHALQSDLDLHIIEKFIKHLSDQNENLIKRLNE